MTSPLVGVRGRFAGASLLWAAGIALLLLVPGGTRARVASHGIWLVLALLAGLAMWHRAAVEPAGRSGWRLIAVGLFMAAIYSAVRLLTLTVGTPSPALLVVALTVLPYPLAVMGMLLWPLAQRRQRLHAVLDATIFAGSAPTSACVAGATRRARSKPNSTRTSSGRCSVCPMRIRNRSFSLRTSELPGWPT